MLYVEYATFTPGNRNKIALEDNILSYLPKKGAVPMYRSVYSYDEEIIEYMKSHTSLKNFPGKKYITNVPIDIDKGTNSDEYVLEKARKMVYRLEELEVFKESYQIYFSGRGYHIMVSNKVFGFNPDPDLPILVEASMLSMGLAEDKAVLRRSSSIRLEHSFNEKSELYKIPLTKKELMELTPEEIHSLAKTPRIEFNYPTLTGTYQLRDRAVEVENKMPEKSMQWNVDINAHLFNYMCIQLMLSNGPQEGNRNNSVLRIASHLKWVGIPVEYAKNILLQWNSSSAQSLDPEVVTNKVEYIYRTAVKYSCKDNIMRFYCRPSCKEYKHRDESHEPPLNNKQMNHAFKEWLAVLEHKDEYMNLRPVFDLEDDCILFPGELVTFLADTGMGKTSLLQNIALGFDMRNQVVRPHKQSILFYETELGAGIMQERFLSIVSGLSRFELAKDLSRIEEYSKLFENISLQTGRKSVEGIEEMIQKFQPEVVVVDYLEKVLHPLFDKGMDQQAISQIMRELASMAMKYRIVIVVLSLINRASTKDPITLHSGKGSSSIEGSSRRIFGIDGSQDSPHKYVSQLKANNDKLFKGIHIKRQDNWRYLRQ